MRTVEEIKADIASAKQPIWKRQFENELYKALTSDIPLDRLEAICAAEKDGRLITLPCKVGDTAFIIPGSFIIGLKVISILVNVRGTVFLEFNSTTFPNARATDVGKTVFLTRAEAEKALGKEQT